jgi:hypothetical protein
MISRLEGRVTAAIQLVGCPPVNPVLANPCVFAIRHQREPMLGTSSETTVARPDAVATACTATASNPHSGIIRGYDPITGRWLSNDPIGISGGLNQYVFCNNNPVNFRDPFGLCSDDEQYPMIDGLPYPWDPSNETAWEWLRHHILRSYRHDIRTHYWVSRGLSRVLGSRGTYRLGIWFEQFEQYVYGMPIDESDLTADWLGAYRLPLPQGVDRWEPWERPPRTYPAPPPELPPRQYRREKRCR